MASQRSGTKLPTRTEQIAIQKDFHLPPIEEDTAGEVKQAGSQREPWIDANNGSAQDDFAGKLIIELNKAITVKYDGLKWKATAKPLPMDSLLGAGAAAMQVVNEAFAPWIANAVLTKQNLDDQRKFSFTTTGAGATLVDALDVARRTEIGQPVNPDDMLKFLARVDDAVTKLMTEHHFDPDGSLEEGHFLRDRVLNEVLDKRRPELSECDRLGYSSTRPGLRKAVVTPVPSTPCEPEWTNITDQAPMQRRYEIFETLIHEYIHILEHPVLPAVTGQSTTVHEGVCEWLTCLVISDLVTAASQERLERIVTTVEGQPLPVPVSVRAQNLRKFLRQYEPKSEYKKFFEAVRRVENITGPNGLKAAFFQGHVEFIGLLWRGGWLPGAVENGGVRAIRTPRGNIKSVDGLAEATKLSRASLLQSNPVLGQPSEKWPGQIFLPGYHSHLTITVGDDQAEAWDQIGGQHNISEADLKQANLVQGREGVPLGTWLLVPDENG